MSAKVARGGPARGRAKPRGRSNGRGVNTRKPKRQGLLESVGISPAWTRRLGNWALAGMTCAVIVAAIARLPPAAARRRSRSARASAAPASP